MSALKCGCQRDCPAAVPLKKFYNSFLIFYLFALIWWTALQGQGQETTRFSPSWAWKRTTEDSEMLHLNFWLFLILEFSSVELHLLENRFPYDGSSSVGAIVLHVTIDLFEENFPPLNFRVKERMVAFQTSTMSPCLNLKSIIKILNFFFLILLLLGQFLTPSSIIYRNKYGRLNHKSVSL